MQLSHVKYASAFIATVAGLGAPSALATATIYSLGTLGGSNSYGFAINTSGEAAGYSGTTGNAASHAFRYSGTPGSGGAMADLGTLGGSNSYGIAMNASG